MTQRTAATPTALPPRAGPERTRTGPPPGPPPGQPLGLPGGARSGAPEKRASRRSATGFLGEELACRFLVDRGYRILARNCWFPGGELDIVASRDGVIAAIEVKTRSTADFGAPLSAVTTAKVHRVRRLLLTWARQNAGLGRRLRVEAIGITLRPGREARIQHLIGLA
ncbi:YraN family protein [Leucobacter sp. M11]|uniref:YraN family protein n=1 Tax=Leucobacter sp. M11 TaxID=2993565 RepID=UPI002D7EDEDB|nr:YraN family protein [Leucobacter sp. M11]MEB4613244.1 YraN family protein [Leucobacter sp. M11]